MPPPETQPTTPGVSPSTKPEVLAEISRKGRIQRSPAIQVENHTVVITGSWLKTAAIYDEHWQPEEVEKPELLVAKLKSQPVRADIFTFAQKLTDREPRFPYSWEWENAAAIPIRSYDVWWESLPQETRKNVRRAGKRGVTVRPVTFDDSLVEGIKAIYDETPVRQGRAFWHYGKDFPTVKRENGTYLDRCDFIGAFCGGELIGFLKMVYVGRVSSIMQILSKNMHFDKRPTNALIAKAVEVCEQKKMAYFVYGQYVYGRDSEGPLTEFKRRNGFEQIRFPRYYVPLTTWGSVCVKCGLHLGVKRFLPARLERTLLNCRAGLNRLLRALRSTHPVPSGPKAAGEPGKEED